MEGGGQPLVTIKCEIQEDEFKSEEGEEEETEPLLQGSQVHLTAPSAANNNTSASRAEVKQEPAAEETELSLEIEADKVR